MISSKKNYKKSNRIEGLYIHIPFCRKKCPYCDFLSFTDLSKPKKLYLHLLLKELELYLSLYEIKLKSIYFGGGTPSLIPPSLYQTFFKKIKEFLRLNSLEEITIEINPEDYTEEDLKILREMGINRLSIGVQSFLNKNLQFLKRRHSPEDSIKKIELAYKVGFQNISIDLIWGLPSQTQEDLNKEFLIIRELPITHISAYKLTVYEETPLYYEVAKGKVKLPTDEIIETLYWTLLENLYELGFKRYEISSFGKTEKYFSIHNRLYWEMKPFLGLGVGAWSFDLRKRWKNFSSLDKYERALKNQKFPVEQVEIITQEEFRKEKIILGLRTTKGIELELVNLKKIPEEILKEFFIIENNRLRFNDKGFLVSNTLLTYFI